MENCVAQASLEHACGLIVLTVNPHRKTQPITGPHSFLGEAPETEESVQTAEAVHSLLSVLDWESDVTGCLSSCVSFQK